MRTIKSCFVGLSHITQRSLQGQKLLLRNYFLLSFHCESYLFEYLYSAGSRSIRKACSCYLLSLRRGVLMGTFTVKRWDVWGLCNEGTAGCTSHVCYLCVKDSKRFLCPYQNCWVLFTFQVLGVKRWTSGFLNERIPSALWPVSFHIRPSISEQHYEILLWWVTDHAWSGDIPYPS